MNKRVTELDGMRAIAVGLVFLNHFAPVKSAPWMDLLHRIGWAESTSSCLVAFVTGILLDARTASGILFLRSPVAAIFLYYGCSGELANHVCLKGRF